MVHSAEKLLIVGSLNANHDDRSLSRAETKTVQALDDKGEIQPIIFFDNWGELGVSSIVWDKNSPTIWYLTTGVDLFQIDIATKQIEQIDIPKLRGVHEISLIGGVLWISNTYFDEIISYDLQKKQVIQRLKLKISDHIPEHVSEENVDRDDTTRINKFHCNQLFETYDGDVFALVHHVTGEQLMKRVAQKLIKSQGNGGVLNIVTGENKRLKLKAPHSVRKVNDQYWIFDSGHAQLNIYDRSWKLIKEVKMAGWGRGGDYSALSEVYYAGVSAKRKRYLSKVDSDILNQNMLQAFNLHGEEVYKIPVPNIEQINNLYLISNEVYQLLRAMDK